MKGWKTIFQANGNQKREVATLPLDRIDFKSKHAIREKEGN